MIKNDKNQKKRGVGLLLGLSIYAFFSILLLNSGNVSVEYSNAQPQTDSVAITNDFEYKEIGELEIEEIEEEQYLLEEDNQGDVEGEVKGFSVQEFLDYLRDFFEGSCDAFHEIDKAQLFCGGSGLSKTADIRIAQIWAPDIMFVGAAAPFDNLVLTQNPRGNIAFRNSSEIINPDFDYYINMPPNDPSAPILDSIPLPDKEKFEPYKMHYEAAGNLNKIPNDVHPEEKSKCPKVVNGGEFNVKGSNNLQKELTDSITPPGIMELGDRDVSSRVCDEYREIELWEDDSFLLCSEGILQVLDCGTKFSFFDQCKGLGDIYIDGILGSGERCNENDCSVRYSEAANILYSPPSWTRDMYPRALTAEEKENDYIIDDTVVITTPCYVRVNCQMCATRCIWDISMWQHVFQLEKMFTYPGYKNAMDDDLYWKHVEDEIKWRSRIGTRKY